MQTFVRFGRWHGRTFHETLGTSSFYRLDGRMTMANAHQDAIDECLARGYSGFQYYQGDHILAARAIGYPADCRALIKGTA